jgi:hypothetical protein
VSRHDGETGGTDTGATRSAGGSTLRDLREPAVDVGA